MEKGGGVSEFRGQSEEQILQRIEDGESISEIAQTFGVNRSTLWRWLEAEPQRSARAKLSRIISAEAYDEKAIEVIEMASDPFELARGKELAHHYRWRASKIDPRGYGDRQQIEHSGSVNLGDRLSRAMKGDEE